MTLVGLVAVVALVLRQFGNGAPSVTLDHLRRWVPDRRLTRLAGAALVSAYAASLGLDLVQSRLIDPTGPFGWQRSLPIPVVDDLSSSTLRASQTAWLSALSLGLAAIESAALGTLVLALVARRDGGARQMTAVLGCSLALLSLTAPVLSTTDPYEYVATGLLGLRAYAPPHAAFVGTVYAAIAHHVPLTGVIYGPLWVIVDTLQTACGSTVAGKIEAIRVWNVGLIGITLWLLARAGVARGALAAFALNPAVWYFSVANPHADIEGIALLVAAHAAARRTQPRLATALIVAAGLVKVPFAVVGGIALAPLASARTRWVGWCAAVGLVVALSYVVPGPAYARDFAQYTALGVRAGVVAIWLGFALLAAGATAAFVAYRRGTLGLAWLFHQMAPLAAPWYLMWGIPYALAVGGLERFLIPFPLAAARIAHSDPISGAVAGAEVLVLAGDLIVSRKRLARRRANTSAEPLGG